MKRSEVWASLLALGMGISAVSALGQDGLPLPSPVEKELAARAKHVTEVTLDKNMLAFAAKFMDADKKGGDDDDKAVKDMIRNLRGVYVREYDFDKDQSYTEADIEGLRKYFANSDWSPMVREWTKGKPDGTDVFVKLVNGQMQGLFVLDAEARELSLVMILGPIDMEKISKLGGSFGIPKDAVRRAQKEAGK